MAVHVRFKRWMLLALSTVMVLLLSGCFRYDHRVKIDDDGSGSIQMTAVFDPEIAFEQMSGQRVIFDRSPGYDRDEVCEAIQPPDGFASGFDDGSIIPYEKNDFCGFRAEMELAPAVDHSESLEILFEPGSTLIKTGEGWEFTANLDQAVFTDMVDTLELNSFEFETYAEAAQYRIDIQLPGAAVDGMHNADDVSGGRFIWNVDVLDVPDQIFAATAPAPPFWENTTTLAVLGILVVGLAAIVGFFVFGGREQTAVAQVEAAPAKRKLRREREPEVVAPVNTEPYFDETFGVWVREDAVHGRVWHDTKRDVWVPF